MRTAHVPVRRCLGCGRTTAKPDLARFVAVTVDGERVLTRDAHATLPGRGLYICPTRACYEAARKRRAFQRGARLRGESLRIDDDLVGEFDG